MIDNTIKAELKISYKPDWDNNTLRVSVRNDRVWFVQWDKDVPTKLLEADNRRIFGLLAGLFGFASACSQHTHVLNKKNYGTLIESPFFEVELSSEQHIPEEIVEIINHFNDTSTVGKIIPKFLPRQREESLPRSNSNVTLVSGGKDSAWNLFNCSRNNIKHTSLFVEGTTINAEFLNELPATKNLVNLFDGRLRSFKIWHADTNWKSLIMQHRTIWRDLVLITLARLVGGNIYTGINKDAEFDNLDKKINDGIANAKERFQLSFHFHNSSKAIEILSRALDANIYKIPSEFEVYKQLKNENSELLEMTHSCQDPIIDCNPYDENYWKFSCTKCKTLAVYDFLVEEKQLNGNLLEFALSEDFGGDMYVQKTLREKYNYLSKEEFPPKNKAYDVAISYASEDSIIAETISSFLTQLNQNIYMYKENLYKDAGKDLILQTKEVYQNCKNIIALSSQNWYKNDRQIIQLERKIIKSRVAKSSNEVTIINIDNSDLLEGLGRYIYITYNNDEKNKLLNVICKRLKISATNYLISKISSALPIYGNPVQAIKSDNELQNLNANHRNHYLWLLVYYGEKYSQYYEESVKKYASPLMYMYFVKERKKLDIEDTLKLARIDKVIESILIQTYHEFVDGLIEIPGGEVYIGFPDNWYSVNESEIPQDLKNAFANKHAQRISIPTFWIDKYPFTRRWAFLLDHNVSNDFTKLRHMNNKVEENAPITQINYDEARGLAQLVGRKIPTNYQWEKAARGGIFLDHNNLVKNKFPLRLYSWEPKNNDAEYKDSNLGLLNDLENDTNYMLQNVNISRGSSPYGVCDMCGNAWEFVVNHLNDQIVHIKGGSFNKTVYPVLNTKVGMVSANPTDINKSMAEDNIGFRTVCDKKPDLVEFRELLIQIAIKKELLTSFALQESETNK
ncbi:MAG: SUMF1/EgtB/PvdO family nonheme iron enzyme [Bacteroidales bacterium]|jgi:formylglycine-generating enzyme required for sulfatase activity|nr:SUMF1/EgtB/PvdO family nonheme iron enzyme [Bacteroidales bacterium]